MKPRSVRSLILLSGVVLFGTTVVPATAQLPGVPRTVNYRLKDNVYEPSSPLKVKKGETIIFNFTNGGKVVHEAVIGSAATQAAEEQAMAKMGTMGTMADAKDRVSVKPGQTKQLTIKFDKTGKFEIGCHQPSHYKLGMKVPIVVS